MTGWRLGYAIGPIKLIEKMGLMLQTIISCLPAFTQIGAIAAINKSDHIIKNRISEFRSRRDTLVQGLNSIPGISCVTPEGAFYAFANIKKTGFSSIGFADFMLNHGVCVLPGDFFGSYGKGFVRLSFGSASVPQIKNAVKIIKNALKSKEAHETK